MDVLINIDVDDLGKAAAFYTGAFGLRIGRRFGESGIELLGGGAPIYLLMKAAGTAPFEGGSQGRSYDRHWSPVHLDFVVDRLDQALLRALECGARQEGAPRDTAWGRIALLSDPFGHGFCLIEFKGRGYDEIAR